MVAMTKPTPHPTPKKSNRTRSNFAVQRNGAVALGVQG